MLFVLFFSLLFACKKQIKAVSLQCQTKRITIKTINNMKSWNEMTEAEQLAEAMKTLKRCTSKRYTETIEEKQAREDRKRRIAKADFCNMFSQPCGFIEI